MNGKTPIVTKILITVYAALISLIASTYSLIQVAPGTRTRRGSPDLQQYGSPFCRALSS